MLSTFLSRFADSIIKNKLRYLKNASSERHRSSIRLHNADCLFCELLHTWGCRLTLGASSDSIKNVSLTSALDGGQGRAEQEIYDSDANVTANSQIWNFKSKQTRHNKSNSAGSRSSRCSPQSTELIPHKKLNANKKLFGIRSGMIHCRQVLVGEF